MGNNMTNRAFSLPKSSIGSEYFEGLGVRDIVWWSVLNIGSRGTFRVRVERVTPLRPQGIWLCTDQEIEMIGSSGRAGSQQVLMFDSAPHEFSFVCTSSNGLLNLYNVWEIKGQRRSQMRMSGMRIEPTNNGFRYFCTDTGPEPDFSRFVFTLERLDPQPLEMA